MVMLDALFELAIQARIRLAMKPDLIAHEIFSCTALYMRINVEDRINFLAGFIQLTVPPQRSTKRNFDQHE